MCKRVSSFVICCAMVLCVLCMPASARGGLPDFSMTRDEWAAAWPDIGNTNVCLTPGGDETQINFAWHCGADDGEPVVAMSRFADMRDARRFFGVSGPADEGFNTSRVTATGLEPNTVYYYTYGNGLVRFGPFVFRTTDPARFKFLYFNDAHQGYDANNPDYAMNTSYKIHSVLNTAVTENPDIGFMLSGGDTVRSGYVPGEWNALLASPVFRSLPIAFAIGNHDKTGDMMRHYVNNPNAFDFFLPSATGTNYWFRYGNALFLVFDSTNGNAAEHIRFAKEAVVQNLDAKWRIGMLHHDIYTPAYPLILPAHVVFTPIADMAGLDILLRGHSHIYGRSHFMRGGRIATPAFGTSATDPQGTMYISMNALQNEEVSAVRIKNIWTAKRVYSIAAVYSTFEVQEDALVYKAFSPVGELRDEYTIHKTLNDPKPFEEPTGPSLYSAVKLIGFIYALFDYLIN